LICRCVAEARFLRVHFRKSQCRRCCPRARRGRPTARHWMAHRCQQRAVKLARRSCERSRVCKLRAQPGPPGTGPDTPTYVKEVPNELFAATRAQPQRLHRAATGPRRSWPVLHTAHTGPLTPDRDRLTHHARTDPRTPPERPPRPDRALPAQQIRVHTRLPAQQIYLRARGTRVARARKTQPSLPAIGWRAPPLSCGGRESGTDRQKVSSKRGARRARWVWCCSARSARTAALECREPEGGGPRDATNGAAEAGSKQCSKKNTSVQKWSRYM
jgi:hypothetical protein